jgi:NAD(P)-dependent dehydrogenase (short-subunit alcohol dehydrogenase family)
VESLIKTAVDTFGRIDIMVNNAGIAIEAGEHGNRPVWDVDEQAFERTMQVNVRGVFLGVKFASKAMMGQEPGESGDRGWIINLASVYGLGGGPMTCEFLNLLSSIFTFGLETVLTKDTKHPTSRPSTQSWG